MALDEVLLASALKWQAPILRFYSWREPAATFGYFQRYQEVAATTPLRPLIRRPTGGGIVPHDHDWTYSLAFPASDPWYELKATESYRRVHELVRYAFGNLGVSAELAPAARKTVFGQCFEGYEQSDVLWKGKKIAGAAQRRTREGLLIQGSVQPPPVGLSRKNWEAAFLEAGRALGGLEWQAPPTLMDVEASAEVLAREKYRSVLYNQKR
jgi:lipoate-protein ligase A